MLQEYAYNTHYIIACGEKDEVKRLCRAYLLYIKSTFVGYETGIMVAQQSMRLILLTNDIADITYNDTSPCIQKNDATPKGLVFISHGCCFLELAEAMSNCQRFSPWRSSTGPRGCCQALLPKDMSGGREILPDLESTSYRRRWHGRKKNTGFNQPLNQLHYQL